MSTDFLIKVIEDDDCPGYASVTWFSEPEYIYTDKPLGVRCKEDGSARDEQYGCSAHHTDKSFADHV